MPPEQWLLTRVRLAASEASDKVKQFAFETLADVPDDEFVEIREGFVRVGVWSLQNSLPIFKAIQRGKLFTILVGMRPALTFHLGHLTLMRELCWLVERGGQPVFLFASYEAGKFVSTRDAELEMALFGETYLKFTGTLLPETAVSFSDRECQDLQTLEDRVAECLTVRKVLQLYGWDESVSVATLRIPAITAAAFLFPAIRFLESPTLVLSDIHQITHAEATKIVARQLKMPPPSYSYRMLLPSLEGPAQRMSVKNPKSVILLDDAREQIATKLQRSFSGGRLTPEEQRTNGGNPHCCSFFKIAEVLQPRDETTQMHRECVSGASLCGECKQKHIPTLVEKIHALSSTET